MKTIHTSSSQSLKMESNLQNWYANTISMQGTKESGILLVLVVGFAACGSSVIHNHPLAYNGQLILNSTAFDQLEASSFEASGSARSQVAIQLFRTLSQLQETTDPDYATNQTQATGLDSSASEYLSTDRGQDSDHIYTVTDFDIPVTTLLLNSSIEESNLTQYNVTDNSSSEGYKMAAVSSTVFTTGIIVGICLLVIIVAVLVGAISFILYRHSMWNRPQTLSDKCSNDESTGYIDDTFRENSEEMYSLDNDSFLNSLEAMTIQNYWTDHVKHTKL